MKKKIYTLAVGLILAACSKRGEIINTTEAADNYNVEFLFEVDNIRMYRFTDYGNTAHYFCKDMTVTQQSCGKNCKYDETIQTKQ